MESIIGQLINRYERGNLTRRDLIRGLTMLAAGAGVGGGAAAEAQTPGLKLINIDHVQINSGDVRKSTEFYQKVLGMQVLRVGPPDRPTCCPDESAFMGINNSLMIAIRKATPVGALHHFGFRCENFNNEAVTKIIASRGAEFKGSYVKDPDGCLVQLSD